jgi:hypothetical protein
MLQPRLKRSALTAPGAATRYSAIMGRRDRRPAMTFLLGLGLRNIARL